jgi:hypothetical protein
MLDALYGQWDALGDWFPSRTVRTCVGSQRPQMALSEEYIPARGHQIIKFNCATSSRPFPGSIKSGALSNLVSVTRGLTHATALTLHSSVVHNRMSAASVWFSSMV